MRVKTVALRIRRDVWRLSDENLWHPIILSYAKAIARLQTFDTGTFADPRSWRHLAEIHGASIPQNQWPPGAIWNACEHGSWYFLPWHRVYLHHFEKIVRDAVKQVGGPASWALPYWNYTDPQRPQVRQLPPAFRQQTLPDGSPNPLFITQRGPTMNTTGQLGTTVVSTTAALGQPEFTDLVGGGTVPGFGGGVSGRTHSGGIPGVLESVPHGSVHVGVGGSSPPGWMSRFETAGRDPIFWLHHANIDRLWAQWLRTVSHDNPTDNRWLRESFEFGSGQWHTLLATKDVLNSRAAPLRYRYDDEPARRAAVTRAARTGRAAERVVRRGPPEMVGATGAQIPLGPEPSHAEIDVTPARAAGRATFAGERQPERTYLKIENVRGTELTAGSFEVYVNTPPNASPEQLAEHLAGTIGMFGVIESSQRSATHGGDGLTFSFDITDLVRKLEAAGTWDPAKLRVTFVPIPDGAGKVYPGDLKVGRVSLHRG
jgi:tyrosinase